MESKGKVLIVDDLLDNISIVESILKLEGYTTSHRFNGKQAIEDLEENDYDVILMDIMMPVMDGYEATTLINSNPKTKDIPVLFLTAKADIDSISKAYKTGGVDFITKPFNRLELIARVKTHINIQRQRKELIELNATKDKFFSIISHDLRSPFNSIIGLTDILSNELSTLNQDEIVNIAQTIHKSTKDTYFLIDNLLEWSKSQTNRLVTKPIKFNIINNIMDVITLLEGQALMKSIVFKQELPSEIQVYADQRMIETTIRNLVSNAIKFTKPEGEVKISIEDKNESIQVNIEDNGVGMTEEQLSLLFKVNTGFKSKGTMNETGTGLGLLLCKDFIERNNGSISVTSKVNQGSKFSILIPKNG
jgi:signal transduction histidine kinase